MMLQWSHQCTCCGTPFIRKLDLGQKGNHISSFVIDAIAVCVKLCTKLSVFGRIFSKQLGFICRPVEIASVEFEFTTKAIQFLRYLIYWYDCACNIVSFIFNCFPWCAEVNTSNALSCTDFKYGVASWLEKQI